MGNVLAEAELYESTCIGLCAFVVLLKNLILVKNILSENAEFLDKKPTYRIT